ncbi:MAG: LysR family transcriptional regulator [Burkholderiaceae bacterium]
MGNEIGWELYRTFLAVLEEGSLSGAARALGLTQPTVGRHIAALEEALPAALFTRSPQGLIPTDTALALKPYAQSLRSTAAALARVAGEDGGGVRGTVRVTASDVIGIEVLPPVLAALRAAHPRLQVELVLTDRVQDLLQHEADIAVRMARPRQEQLVAQRAGTVEIGLHASSAYLQRAGVPRALAALQDHALIGFDQETAFVRGASKGFEVWQRDAFALRADSNVAQLALIRAGGGIGLCQVPLAQRAPPLTRVLPGVAALALEVWITMHGDLRASPRCRVVFDALVQALQAHCSAT